MIHPGGLPSITYSPRGEGGGSSLLYILHAKRGQGVQIGCKIAYVINGRPPETKVKRHTS